MGCLTHSKGNINLSIATEHDGIANSAEVSTVGSMDLERKLKKGKRVSEYYVNSV